MQSPTDTIGVQGSTCSKELFARIRVLENVWISLDGSLLFHSFGGNTTNNKTISFTADRSQLPEKDRVSRLGYCNNPPRAPTIRSTDFPLRGGEASAALDSRHQLFQNFTSLQYKGVGFYRIIHRNAKSLFCQYLSVLGCIFRLLKIYRFKWIREFNKIWPWEQVIFSSDCIIFELASAALIPVLFNY